MRLLTEMRSIAYVFRLSRLCRLCRQSEAIYFDYDILFLLLLLETTAAIPFCAVVLFTRAQHMIATNIYLYYIMYIS